jgi:hypothetical protein
MIDRHPRLQPIAACVAAAFVLATSLAPGAPNLGPPPPPTLTVTNCGDGGTGSGSFRDLVSNNSVSGATIDLSKLDCSLITLANGAVINHVDALILQGPANNSLTIDGNLKSRVFVHDGHQTLAVRNLKVTRGAYSAGGYGGGCIYAVGSVSLYESTISYCEVSGLSTFGAGVYTHGDLSMTLSTISGNRIVAGSDVVGGGGGGAYVGGTFYAIRSTVRDNYANSLEGKGGGVWVHGGALLDDLGEPRCLLWRYVRCPKRERDGAVQEQHDFRKPRECRGWHSISKCRTR